MASTLIEVRPRPRDGEGIQVVLPSGETVPLRDWVWEDTRHGLPTEQLREARRAAL